MFFLLECDDSIDSAFTFKPTTSLSVLTMLTEEEEEDVADVTSSAFSCCTSCCGLLFAADGDAVQDD